MKYLLLLLSLPVFAKPPTHYFCPEEPNLKYLAPKEGCYAIEDPTNFVSEAAEVVTVTRQVCERVPDSNVEGAATHEECHMVRMTVLQEDPKIKEGKNKERADKISADAAKEQERQLARDCLKGADVSKATTIAQLRPILACVVELLK